MEEKFKQVQEALKNVYEEDDLTLHFSLIWSSLYGWSVEGKIENYELETSSAEEYKTPEEALDAFLIIIEQWKQAEKNFI